MTSTSSVERPRSQIARTKRSTSTVVFPVPAPAETKTTPEASIAADCSVFGTRVMAVVRPLGGVDRSFQTARHAERALPDGDNASVVSCPLHPTHRIELAPARALAPARIVDDVAGADPPRHAA